MGDGKSGYIVIGRLNSGLHAERIGPKGNLLWGSNEILNTMDNSASELHFVPDGTGGFIFSWTSAEFMQDYTYRKIRAQRITGSGNIAWGPEGIAVSNLPYSEWFYQMVSDGEGGATLIWMEFRNVTGGVFAQKISPDGHLLWSPVGIEVADGEGWEVPMFLSSDREGGILTAWMEQHDPNFFIQRVDTEGNRLWDPYGLLIPFYPLPTTRFYSDGADGIIYTKSKMVSNSPIIYKSVVNRINGVGQFLWGPDGIELPGDFEAEYAFPDGNGNFIIVSNSKAQKLDPTGNPLWSEDGIDLPKPEIQVPSYNEHEIIIKPDGRGGLFKLTEFYSYSAEENKFMAHLWLQKVDSSGAHAWSRYGADFLVENLLYELGDRFPIRAFMEPDGKGARLLPGPSGPNLIARS